MRGVAFRKRLIVVNQVKGTTIEVEIGFSICKKYSGNGYATECTKAMTDYTIQFLYTIPRVKRDSAITIISEIGIYMGQFSNSKRLCF